MNTGSTLTRIILRPLSALSLDEVNIAKRNITTGLFGFEVRLLCICHLSYTYFTSVQERQYNPKLRYSEKL
jgi:hypothetical protein